MKASRRVKRGALAIVIAIVLVLVAVFLASEYHNPKTAEKTAISEDVPAEQAAAVPEQYEQKTTADSIAIVGARTGNQAAKVEFKGLKTGIADVSAKVVRKSNPAFKSDIFAVKDAEFSEAEVTLKKTGEVKAIFYCSDFDFENEKCRGSWEKTAIPFTQTSSTLTFTVTHFSGYAGGDLNLFSELGGSGDCGAYVNNDSTLMGNISGCTGNGTIINASNIILDCQGYSISGNFSQLGIVAVDVENITIRNCNVFKFSNGILLHGNNNASVLNNTLHNNFDPSAASADIWLDSVNSSYFANNRIYSENASGIYSGIYISGSNSDLFEGNNIQNSSIRVDFANNNLSFISNIVYGQDYGLSISTSHSYSLENSSIINNSFYDNADGVLLYRANNILVENNSFYNNSEYGFYIQKGANFLLRNNVAYDNPDGFMLEGTNISLQGNVAHDNTNSGFALGGGSVVNASFYGDYAYSNKYGLLVTSASFGSLRQNITVYNSTFVNNLLYDVGMLPTAMSTNLTIINSSIGPKMYVCANLCSLNISPLVISDLHSSINYGNFVLTNFTINDSITLSYNFVSVNSSKTPFLNTSSNITFFDLSWTAQPQLFRDSVRCDNDSALCNLTYDVSSGTAVAQVASFSNYTTGNASTCYNVTDDLYINRNSVMCAASYYANDTGDDGIVIINQSNVRISFAFPGVTITGNNSGKGVVAENKTNITIAYSSGQSASFSSFNYSSSFYFKNVSNSHFTYLSARYSGIGIYLYNSTLINVTGSETIANNRGVIIYSGGNNSVSADANAESYGFNITDSHDNYISGGRFHLSSDNTVGVLLDRAVNTLINGDFFSENISAYLINSTNADFQTFYMQHGMLYSVSSSAINISYPVSFNNASITLIDSSAEFSLFTMNFANTSIELINSSANMANISFFNNNVGILINKSSDVNISSLNFTNSTIPIYLESSSGVSMSGLHFKNISYGIYSISSNASASGILLKYPMFSDAGSKLEMENLTFSADNASINYNGLLINASTNTSSGLYLLWNLSGLDPSALPALNRSATITLYNLLWPSTPFITKDGIRCDNTSSCTLISYNNTYGTLVFNVTSFSNYSSSNPNLPGTPDTTPPTQPNVYDGASFVDRNWTSSNTTLSGSWNGSEDRSNIFYSYRFRDSNSSCPAGCALKYAGSAQQVTASNLTLAECHTYYLDVQAEDTFYNSANISSSDGITVDTKAPFAPASINSPTHPNPAIYYPSATVSLNWTLQSIPDDNSSGCAAGIEGYSYVLTQDEYELPDEFIDSNSSEVTFSNVQNGIWYFKVLAIDRAGNAGDSLGREVRINATTAEITLDPVATPTLLPNATIFGEITKNVSDILAIYKNDVNIANISIGDTQYSFAFTIDLDLGINAIYVNALLNGSVAATSNKLYVRRLSEERLNITGFTLSYSGGSLSDDSASNLISTDSSDADYGIGKSSGKLFLFVTNPDADTATRKSYVTNNSFFDLVNPSVGYPLYIEQGIISTILNYADLSIIGNQSVGTGRYTLVITNNGTVNGKPQVVVRIT